MNHEFPPHGVLGTAGNKMKKAQMGIGAWIPIPDQVEDRLFAGMTLEAYLINFVLSSHFMPKASATPW